MRSNKILLILALIPFLSVDLQAQSSDLFSKRISEIALELESKADSLMPQLNENLELDVTRAPIQEYLGLIAESHRLNISVSSELDLVVSHRFSQAKVKDVLLFLCQTHRLDIDYINNIISVIPFKEPEAKPEIYREKSLDIRYNPRTDKVDISLDKDSLRLFTKQFTIKTGINLIHDADLDDARVTGFMKSVDPKQALRQLSYSNNFIVNSPEEGFFILSKEGKKKTKTGSNEMDQDESSLEIDVDRGGIITVAAKEVQFKKLIDEVFAEAGLNFYFTSVPDHKLSVVLKKVPLHEFMELVFQNTEYTYHIQNGIYFIGKRDEEGLRLSKLIQLRYRSVEDLDQVIPTDLKKEVQITTFTELNSLIVSGSQPMIHEIQSFIKELDKPVPNIMIEVILVDVRKGYNLQTGLQAFLTDSVQARNTTGSVFPGLDVTLGTGVINNAFDKVGLTRLGRVTPRFYATLRAIEDNNDIDIRSTPQLATLNGHEASLTIGQSVFFVQRTQNVNSGVNPITTISEQFKQVEANLSVLIKPLVSGNNHVTLDITAEFSSFIPPEIENAPPGNATRKFTSKIRVEDDEMIILGGLEEISKSESSSGVPFLSRIPVLSWFFSSKVRESDKNKLMVFIKPTIVY